MIKKFLVGCLFAGTSSLALAHPGHGLESIQAGFAHPFTGLDHLLVMLAVGFWAAKLGGETRWQLPVTFMLVMISGAILGLFGIAFSGLETAIAATVMVMGLLLVISLPLSPALRISLVAMFALMHGLVHGSELSMHNGFQALFGMLLATGLLHGAGLMLGSYRLNVAQWLHASLGWGIMLVGGYLLIA